MKKLLSLALALVLLLTSVVVAMPVGAASYTETEPNNKRSTAQNIANGDTVTGHTSRLNNRDDYDYFAFELTEPAKVTYSGQTSDLNVYTSIDSNGKTHVTAFPQVNKTYKGSVILEPGRHTIMVCVMFYATGDFEIDYTLTLDIVPHTHVYDNECDDTCNDTSCKAVRNNTPHKFADRSDTVCDGCSKSCNHEFNYSCDTECKLCLGSFAIIGHDFEAATCKKPKTCKNCNVTEGEKLEHDYKAATCTKPMYCTLCNATKGSKAPHTFDNACDDSCNVCKGLRVVSHTFDNACDDSCNVCKALRVISHTTKATTTRATLKKNGATVSKCTVCGKTTSTTTIYAVKTVKLSKTQYTYTGKTIKPTLVVQDSKGKTISSKYYTVSGTKSTKSIGKFKITVTFKGNYAGTKTLYYTVNPKTVASLKLTAGKKQMVVSYKKDSAVSGYEIAYATNKSFKKAKTVKATSVKKTVKKLSAKKTYYVKVRAYKKVSGKTYYGAYCKAKTVKIK